MSDVLEKNPDGEEIKNLAAAWVLRCDRGLTPDEQDELLAWLAADPRHSAEFGRHRAHWRRLDKLVNWLPEHSGQPNPDLLAPQQHLPLRRFLPLSVAAVIAVVFLVWKPDPTPSAKLEPTPLGEVGHSTPSRRVLDDGSIIDLNRGAAVSVQFSGRERRVHLKRGEGHFSVVKDPMRPFIVTARGIEVVAVGTAFNLRLDDAGAVEVLVTEGRVQVAEAAPTGAVLRERRVERPLIPLLEARQRAIVTVGMIRSTPEIATLTAGEIERVLAWQHRLLDFTAVPLSEVVAEFNRRNVVQLVIIDPELASVRISASFRSDNIDGFLRLLEVGFGARAERRGEFEVLLRAAR